MAIFGEKHDEFYDVRLIQNARLHLSSVINEQPAPLFFEAMAEIIKRKVYNGYRIPNRKEVKLAGIKDFFHNFHYGLGIKDMAEFISACTEIDIKKSKDKNLRFFLDWLQKEDPDSFEFPPHYWEYRRLMIATCKMRADRDKKSFYLNMLRIIYNNRPEVLKYIGYGRKYKSIPEAYEKEGYGERPTTLTPIKLYRHPTYRDIEALARDINSRLDKLKNRVLIAKLIEIYKINEAIEQHSQRNVPPEDEYEL
jgi:hypothetical protein